LRETLRTVPIPLQNEDWDVVLDLQQVFTTCYDSGAYALDIDYHRPADPPLTPEDAAWAVGLLNPAE
jgi:hypothetical protein